MITMLAMLQLRAQQPPAPEPQASRSRRQVNFDAAAVERGQKVFQSNCSFCHGANAKGGESGPDLVRSPIVLRDENGDQIGSVVLNGRPDKGMPKFPLSHEQISDIATFLHQRVKAAADRGSYQILDIVTGDAKQGEAYFSGPGQCSTCHSATGDLAHIGSRLDPVTIQQRIVMPREVRSGRRRAVTPVPPREVPRVTVTTASGESFEGMLEQIDDFNVALTDDSGNYHSFTRQGNTPKVEVHDPLQMHMEMLSKYTDADIHNLTAYLVGMK
jgi:cytochrome c oxidase cbb3-type subunit III